MMEQSITIQLQGSPTDGGHMRLSELIKQLEFVLTALRQTERLVTGKDDKLLYYKVVDLSHNSPATIVLEATPIKPDLRPQIASRIVTSFFRNLRNIESKGKVSARVDLPALVAYRDLGVLLDKNVSKIKIVNSHFSIDIDARFKERVIGIIGQDEIIEGSMSGMLEWLNIHNTNMFHIYPEVGPKKVNCYFPPSLRQTVMSAIDKHVRVFGELRYKKRDNFAHAIDVRELEILPTDGELPTLGSLHGIANQWAGATERI
ncbi:MAG: hypothetical protein ACRD63_01815 [Pyrinomonadaceae bacterium]